jgi:hypothetical protein
VADVPYGITLSTFLTGTTGMRLQALGASGKDALILGWFLSANEWANMIGLYELSPTRLTRWLPSVKGKALSKAFDLLGQERFAHYDEPTEFVWVREMARVRLALEPGVPANPKEKRIIGAQNLYQRLPLNPFLGPFFDRYRVELSLKHRRNGGNGDRSPTDRGPNGDPSPIEHRSIADRLVIDRCTVPPSTPSGTSTSVPANQDQVPDDQVPVRAAASPRSSTPAPLSAEPQRQPSENYSQILALLHKEILPLGVTDIGDLEEATKGRCAQLRLAYNSEVVRKAVESALHQRRAAS